MFLKIANTELHMWEYYNNYTCAWGYVEQMHTFIAFLRQ